MALANSGIMSIGGTTTNRSINLELGLAQNATSGMGNSNLRSLAGVLSGAISMDDFYGASSSTCTDYDSSPMAESGNDACEYEILSEKYYHGGSAALPTIGDMCYENSDCTGTLETGYYKIAATVYIYIEEGEVISKGTCR